MPEIKPDLTDTHRCVSVHWSLPAQCVLPRSHRENWHEAWHPQTGNRIRYRRAFGSFLTEELRGGDWNDLAIPAPGDVCGEPHGTKPGVFCEDPRKHNERSWTHQAAFEGCRYTWNTLKRDATPEQAQQDVARLRELAAQQGTELQLLRTQLARALQVLDDGPQWVNDRLQQHWAVPAVRAAEILRAALGVDAVAR